MSIFTELRHRNVIRVGLAYLAVSWLLVQIADTIAPMLQLSPLVPRFILFILLIGFPAAVILAWIFEITPDGIKKTAEITERSTGVTATGHRLNILIIASLVMAIVFLLVDRADVDANNPTRAGQQDAGGTTKSTIFAHGPTVAVLPFTNLAADREQDYFSDGLSEDISTALSRFADIRVIPASMTLAYRDVAELSAVGNELGASYVIGGSVRLSPDAVRISARLIDVATSAQLWGETYDRELNAANLFDIQSDVARRVATTIADASGVLSRVGQHQLVSQSTNSLEAYECVLRSYAYLSIHNAETHLIARECLEQAVQLDPGYVDAWAHLGYIYQEEVRHNRNLEPDALERALSASQRAIELDGANPMAHFAMSMTRFSLYDVSAGMSEAEKMISLNPNDTTKVAALAVFLVLAGDTERGVELARRAEPLMPTPPRWFYMIYASAHYQSGEYDQVMEDLSLWNDEGNDVQWHMHKAAALGQMGKTSEARRELDRMNELFPAFAADPIGEMRKFILSEDVVRKFYEGLRKAGLQAELTEIT
jgi:adenylate cyclase